MVTSTTIIPTGVERTSAAHVVIGEDPITVVWSTIPVACTDWLLGDVTSQGPVRQAPDEVPPVWAAITEVQCEVCGSMVGPWALVRDGHLTGDELTDLAVEIAELADEERESQRNTLIAHLTDEAEDTAHRLADGSLERDEVPNVGAMAEPGVGLAGDKVVAWSTMPALDGGDDPEIVEVARPIPAGCP